MDAARFMSGCTTWLRSWRCSAASRRRDTSLRPSASGTADGVEGRVTLQGTRLTQSAGQSLRTEPRPELAGAVVSSPRPQIEPPAAGVAKYGASYALTLACGLGRGRLRISQHHRRQQREDDQQPPQVPDRAPDVGSVDGEAKGLQGMMWQGQCSSAFTGE